MEWKHADSLVKKKFQADEADSLLGHERTITINFCEKGTTVNSAFNYQNWQNSFIYLMTLIYIYIYIKKIKVPCQHLQFKVKK